MEPIYRVAVVADIHGNLTALEAVLADLAWRAPDATLVIAGDLVGGPQQEAVITRLRGLGAPMVRGNGEDYLTRIETGAAPAAWLTHRQYAMARWTYDQTSPAARDFLRALPVRLTINLPGADPVLVFHGGPDNTNEHLCPTLNPGALERAFASTTEAVLVCGHSHLPWQVRQGQRLAFNPGAVCAPLDGSIGAQYGLLTWTETGWDGEIFTIPYDLTAFERAYRASGVLETGPLARAHLTSLLRGRDWGDAFIRHAVQLAKAAGAPHSPCVPDAIWAQAEQTFPWDDPLPPLTAKT